MPDRTTVPVSPEALVQDMAAQVTQLVRRLQNWVVQETPELHQLEDQIVRSVKDLGSALLVGLCQLTVPRDPPATHPCPCGQLARFQRLRPATCRTLLGSITLPRPY